jgi:TPR repeat protein
MQGGHVIFNEPAVGIQDFNTCVAAAAAGNVDAQIKVGDAYCSPTHRAVALDYRQALYWYAKAASQNSAIALLKLGQLHDRGLGCIKEPMLAFEFYKKAASMGLPDAQYWTGWDYMHGHGVPQNLQSGIDYLNSAAKQGHAASQIMLAEFYLGDLGPGTQAKDRVSGYAWLSIAAQGDTHAKAYASQKMEETTHGMTLAQITEAESRALSPDTLIQGPSLPVWSGDTLVNSKVPKP